MQESIYNLVPREYVSPPKEKMYRSQHDPDKMYVGSTFGCTGSTRPLGAGKVVKKSGRDFGLSDAPGSPTRSPFRATAKETLSPSSSGKFEYTDRRQPPVPSPAEKPICGLKTTRNFITSNAVEVILQAPPVREDPNPNFLLREDFGKVPAYLKHVKEEIRRENDMIQKYISAKLGEIEQPPEEYQQMDRDERDELLAALKLKWDKVNAQYQKITHLVQLDTTGQVRRKETLENQLKVLEEDIAKLEKFDTVLIRP